MYPYLCRVDTSMGTLQSVQQVLTYTGFGVISAHSGPESERIRVILQGYIVMAV
ncbi:hypothetical protein BDQ17DRAFT_1362619 [Cyathus striatus]|nr:hypothetical protein BDQ17DRAFT_1362619 [Cyathus striatus]